MGKKLCPAPRATLPCCSGQPRLGLCWETPCFSRNSNSKACCSIEIIKGNKRLIPVFQELYSYVE